MQPADGWSLAVDLEARWLREPGRVDWLLERFASGLPGGERARCQELLSGAVRNHSRLDAALSPFILRSPRPRLRAILHIAGAEIVEHTAAAPAVIVDHAVGRTREICSKAEAGLVNAVLRRAAPALRAGPPDPVAASVSELSLHYSHPKWLVERWLAQFGRENTVRLLAWNQTAAEVHVRLRPGTTPPACLEPTQWEGFFRLKPGHWAEVIGLVEAGAAYVQDPATRLAPEMLNPSAAGTVLDLCAAPGGKSLHLAERVGSGGCVVCVDQPGPRILRLEQNVARYRAANAGGARMEILAADVLELTSNTFAKRLLPEKFDSVILDAPCSNTGVLRHRVDARWRLRPEDPANQAAVQLKLLQAASAFVAPRGNLVYSTCSLEPEENAGVVQAFLKSGDHGFSVVRSFESRPWLTGHDGAGAFLLRRVSNPRGE